MSWARAVTIGLVLLSCLVLAVGLLAIRYFSSVTSDTQNFDPLNIDWQAIENQVENDIGVAGYQFLYWGDTIPAIDRTEFQHCLSDYADLRQVSTNYTLEYLLKYNQIVRLRMVRAGIRCQ